MRLAYFTNTYPRATDTFIRREVFGLRQRGLDVVTYSVRESGSDHDADDEVIKEKERTHYLLPFSFLNLLVITIKQIVSNPKRFFQTVILATETSRPGLKGHLLQLAYFFESLLLAEQVIQDGIDHIHNHLGDNSGTVTLLAAQLTNTPYSISIHGPHIFFDGLNWALSKKTEKSKFISCIGHFCVSQMMLYCDREYWNRFRIVRCGVDLDQFQYRAPTGKARKLIYVGRLSKEKGIPILLDSIAQLKNQDYDVELEVLGDGDDRKFLQDLTKKKELSEFVKYHGFVGQKEVEEILRNSDIFVLPSFAEGIPVALMEAMAIGIPVIATNVGGIHELVIDQVTGKLVSPSDSIDLAEAIAGYIDNESLCKEIAKRARERVSKEFNIDDQVDKLERLFTENDIQSVK